MPRDGSLILSDVREPTLALVCETRGPSFEHSAAPTFMVFDKRTEPETTVLWPAHVVARSGGCAGIAPHRPLPGAGWAS
jgi:hypothetical protein